MRPENEKRLARIRRISGILRGICKAYLLFCVFALLWQTHSLMDERCGTLGVVQCNDSLGIDGMAFDISDVSGATGRDLVTNSDRVEVGLILVLGFGGLFNCGYQLHRLLGNYARGDVFTTESAGLVRRCGLACVLLGAFDLGLTLAPRLMAVAHNKQSSGGMSTLGIGLGIVAVSWIMEIAAEMREEQEMVI
ncbi:MAG TPA: DUF2975 domain-containing protein [Bryobacteraceae bacterium]|nr:DUF2975 domain-containing protein [Bryobacteraceae bacterium]